MQDVTCRLFGEEMGKILNTQIVVMNKPGASMTLATDAVARSKKDGYTIPLRQCHTFRLRPGD